MHDWQKISNGFNINRKFIWLNSCGISPIHNTILKNTKKFLDVNSKENYLSEEYNYQNIYNKIKKILCELLRCSMDEVSLIHNTAEGMNFFANGLPLKKGESILLQQKEYPSNYYPWKNLEKKGVKIESIPISSDKNQLLERLKKKINKKIKVVSLSAVDWLTGIPIPLKEIGAICKENSILFVLDAAQGLGHIPIDVKEMNISCLCGSAWKWLLGPVGLGYLYISKNILNDIDPVFIGTSSFINEEEYLPYKTQLKENADRFLISTHSILNWVYFLESLEFLKKIGFANIRNRIFYLSDILRSELQKIGYDVFHNGIYKSGIVSAVSPKYSSLDIYKKLKANNVICALRDDRIRFSTHIMNNISHIKKLSKILMGS